CPGPATGGVQEISHRAGTRAECPQMTRRQTLQLAGCFALLTDSLRKAHAQSGNLLVNADFQQGDYQGWTLDPALEKAGKVEVDASTKPFSIRLETNSNN